MPASPDRRDQHLILDLCLRVGELLLSSGAGAADVTVAMRLLADHFGLRRAESDVTFVSLAMSYQDDPAETPVVLMRQVKLREIDYEDLTRVDHLVRDVLAGRLDLAEARSEMAAIVSSGHQRRRFAVTVGWGVMAASVAILLGGGWRVAIIALAAAMVIDRLQAAMQRRRLPFFYRQVAGGVIATLFAVGVARTDLPVAPSLVITANIVMLLAGIGFMGGLQDALSGFYITAGARMTEALLATAGIIAGVSGGLALGDLLGTDLGWVDPGTVGWENLPLTVSGAAVASAAFGYASYAPLRSLLPMAVLGGGAMTIYYTMNTYAFGRAWSAALAALFVGLVAYSVSGRVRVPPLVVVVPAIVPMLPGLSIYRGLSLLSGTTPLASAGMLAMVTAASIAIALAAGVILGEYIAQPLRREARRLETRLSGPRLVGPLRARAGRRRGSAGIEPPG